MTKMISMSYHLTINIFLPIVIHAKKLLMEERTTSDEHIRKMTTILKIKFDKYYDECNILVSVITMLNLCLQMKFINFTFVMIYQSFELKSKIKITENII